MKKEKILLEKDCGLVTFYIVHLPGSGKPLPRCENMPVTRLFFKKKLEIPAATQQDGKKQSRPQRYSRLFGLFLFRQSKGGHS